MTTAGPGCRSSPITRSTRRGRVTATDPRLFAETLGALAEAGYRAVDLDDWVARGRPDEPGGFALAFDDGLRSVLRRRRRRGAPTRPRDRLPRHRPGRLRQRLARPARRRRRRALLSWPEVDDARGVAGSGSPRTGGRTRRSTGSTPPRLPHELRGLARRDRGPARAAPAGSWRIPNGASSPAGSGARRGAALRCGVRHAARLRRRPPGPVRPLPDRRLLPPRARAPLRIRSIGGRWRGLAPASACSAAAGPVAGPVASAGWGVSAC